MRQSVRHAAFALLWLPSAVSACGELTPHSASHRQPNVLILLADDLGYGELGMQGNPQVPTPHIDSIAQRGIRFTQGYVSGPYCSPTRAGLLTGRYQTRFGHEFNPRRPEDGLPLDQITLADRLKRKGYATAVIGKWHLGGTLAFRPSQRGFDQFYGTVANTPFFNPPNFVDSRVSDEVDPVQDPSFYTTDAYAARACQWINEHKDQPWFLYLPFNAQHAPLQAPEKYLKQFDSIADPTRKIFAAMLSAMDDAVGQILATLRTLNQEEHTLIWFLADNGGPTRQTTSRNAPLNGFKATTWEGGIRVPFAVQWTGTIPAGTTYEHPIIQLDILPTVMAAIGSPLTQTDPVDGVNLLPYLKGENRNRPHETLYWRFGLQWAIRERDWKLMQARVDRDVSPIQLFNLSTDPGEQHNLASHEPDRITELRARWETWNAAQQPPRWRDGIVDRSLQKADPKAVPARKTGSPKKARGRAEELAKPPARPES